MGLSALELSELQAIRLCNQDLRLNSHERLLELLRATWGGATPQQRRRRLRVLGAPRAAQVLLEPSEHRVVRSEACRVLEEAVGDRRPLAEALRQAVRQETDRYVRRALVDASASLATEQAAREALEALAKDQEPTVRHAASLYIQQLQEKEGVELGEGQKCHRGAGVMGGSTLRRARE